MAAPPKAPPGARLIGPPEDPNEAPTKETTTEKPKKVKRERTKSNKKSLAITVGLQVVGVVALVASFMISYQVGIESRVQEDRVDEILYQYDQVKDATRQVEGDISALPSAAVAKRWGENSRTHGNAIAQRQNSLMREVVELSYVDIPTEHTVEGEREPVPYTPEERKEMATIARDERIKGYLREMTALFGADDVDERGFVASGLWYRQLGFEPSATLTWVFDGPGLFDKNSSIPVSWTLFDEDSNPVALVSGFYDSEKRGFSDLSATRLVTLGTEVDS